MNTTNPTHWYLAEIIQRVKYIDDEEPPVCWVNDVLIEAASPEDAYQRALEVGDEHNNDNSEFAGFRDIRRIEGELVDGATIYYGRWLHHTEEKLRTFIPSKEDLSIFAPRFDLALEKIVPAFIPKDAVWYLAEYAYANGSNPSIIQFTHGLIYADSPEKAYKKALKYGKRNTPSGDKFFGLGELYVIDDAELEHGVEIIYSDYGTAPDEEVAAMICQKDDLTIFK